MRRVPVVTTVLALTAIVATHAPFCRGLLLDRADALATGEVWRLWTGHLVHGGPWHLGLNLLFFLPLAAWREARAGSRCWFLECSLLMLGVAIGVRVLHPHWTTYEGLSGVVYGLLALTFAGLRPLGWGVVALLAVKSGAEYLGGGWLVGSEPLSAVLEVEYLAGSHLAGLAAALLVLFSLRERESMEPAALRES